MRNSYLLKNRPCYRDDNWDDFDHGMEHRAIVLEATYARHVRLKSLIIGCRHDKRLFDANISDSPSGLCHSPFRIHVAWIGDFR